MSKGNWLEKFRKNPKAQEQLRERAAKAAGGGERQFLPKLVIAIDCPMIVRTLEPSRIVPRTTYGPREVVDVVLLDSTDPAQEVGADFTMWMTQSAFRGQMEKFRDEGAGVINLAGETIIRIPKDLDLFILNNGKKKSEATGHSYWDYSILHAEEGKKIAAEL